MENPALFCAHTGANANTPQIRPAGSQDSEAIARMAHAADMGELSEAGVTYVAEVDGAVVGFIRLVEEDGSWFVNPVVIESARRGRGIGRALMRFARQRKGPLRFVARGYAVPFYRRRSRVGRTRIGLHDGGIGTRLIAHDFKIGVHPVATADRHQRPILGRALDVVLIVRLALGPDLP